MGQKVNPHGLRVGIIKDWDSHWFVDKKDFAANIKEDNEIRIALKKKYYQAAISKIAIEKAAPCFPISTPGLAVNMFIVTFVAAFSITILDMAAR